MAGVHAGIGCRENDALAAHAVATSPLVKTALCGNDPNVGRLAGAIGALEGDRSLAARLGAAGRRGYERAFRIERCVADTVAVYRELIPAG